MQKPFCSIDAELELKSKCTDYYIAITITKKKR